MEGGEREGECFPRSCGSMKQNITTLQEWGDGHLLCNSGLSQTELLKQLDRFWVES